MSNNQLVQTVGTKRTTSLLRSFFFVFPDDDDLVWWMTSTCTDPIDTEHTVANSTCVCVWPTDSHSQGDGDEIGKIVGKETDFPQTYLLCGDVLPSVLECKDLGITVDSTLSFTGHICNIVAKAKLRSSQILHFFLSEDPQVLTKAFVVYVLHPILEYSSPVWSPSAVTYINKLESVQRSFTKRLPGFQKLSYDTRLKRLGLVRLELRRLHADLIMCYKMVHKLVNIPFWSFFTLSQYNSTRGHSLKLFYPDSRVNARASFFSVRIISLWNRLPASLVQVHNLIKFKSMLRTIDLSFALLGKL